MLVELKIEWDGTDVPGVKDHHLSVAAFGEALTALLGALRRTASSMAQLAEGDSERGSRGGRLSAEAGQIDIEIVGLREGSLAADTVCVLRPAARAQQTMVYDLLCRATEKLVDDIEAENRGEQRNAAVRKYLRLLPVGVKHQRYELAVDGRVVRNISLGEPKLVETVAGVTPLRHIMGMVTAVGFAPDPFVQVKSPDGTTSKLPATEIQVERALVLRSAPVQCLALLGKTGRLLWIHPADSRPALPDPEQRKERLHRDWSELMQKLGS